VTIEAFIINKLERKSRNPRITGGKMKKSNPKQELENKKTAESVFADMHTSVTNTRIAYAPARALVLKSPV